MTGTTRRLSHMTKALRSSSLWIVHRIYGFSLLGTCVEYSKCLYSTDHHPRCREKMSVCTRTPRSKRQSENFGESSGALVREIVISGESGCLGTRREPGLMRFHTQCRGSHEIRDQWIGNSSSNLGAKIVRAKGKNVSFGHRSIQLFLEQLCNAIVAELHIAVSSWFAKTPREWKCSWFSSPENGMYISCFLTRQEGNLHFACVRPFEENAVICSVFSFIPISTFVDFFVIWTFDTVWFLLQCLFQPRVCKTRTECQTSPRSLCPMCVWLLLHKQSQNHPATQVCCEKHIGDQDNDDNTVGTSPWSVLNWEKSSWFPSRRIVIGLLIGLPKSGRMASASPLPTLDGTASVAEQLHWKAIVSHSNE